MIISPTFGTIHSTIDSPELGVLFTKCRKCYGTVVKMRDAVKCNDCGWIDDRKLSLDFGKSEFLTQD
jgi:exosome complex component CSL4